MGINTTYNQKLVHTFVHLSFLIFLGMGNVFSQDNASLAYCIETSKSNNVAIKLAEANRDAKRELLGLAGKNMLPNVDILASYNYIGSPLTLNLAPLKEGIVEGSARQNVDLANTVYKEITSADLPNGVQQTIYESSRNLLSSFYPNYNPKIAGQDILLAGMFVRQPLYVGGKLKAARSLALQEYKSSEVHTELTQDFIAYAIALKYLHIQYLNAMLVKQAEKISVSQQNDSYAEDLYKTEMIPMYQRQWAKTFLLEATNFSKDLQLEKQNALVEIKELMGIASNTPLDISSIATHQSNIIFEESETSSPDLRHLESKHQEAVLINKTARKARLPNLFAIGNVQLLQRNLPVITPPWMIGLELQWTVFDGFQRKNKIKTTASLVRESELLIQQKESAISAGLQIAKNNVMALAHQVETLDTAVRQAHTTTEALQKRAANSLSSIKDVNDAVAFEYNLQKAYYTAVVAYKSAIITYFYVNGNLNQRLDYL